MTVLDSVLIEEYERKERIKAAFQEELAKPDCQNREKLEQGLKDIDADQHKILKALEGIWEPKHSIPSPTSESRQRWLQEPQNLMRKHGLFKKLLSDIENFTSQYSPIFQEDKELLWLKENLQRRMKEIEGQLNPTPKITKDELEMIYGSVALDGSSLTKEQVYAILTAHAEPKGKVHYFWTEDGEPELCEYEKLTIPYELRCYHCYNMIEPGVCVKLRNQKGEVYYLHIDCARESISFIKR